MSAPGPWVEEWLSAPRFGVYLGRANGDRGLALALYEWNVRASAAFMHDLAHLEVALRNAYDRALMHGRPADRHWIYDAETLFPPVLATANDGTVIDNNARSREQIITAIASAAIAERDRLNRSTPQQARPLGPIKPTPGHVVAELTFGFWRYLTRSSSEKTLWVPYLHRAYPPGTSRKAADKLVVKLNDLRNRVAHHEPLELEQASRRHSDLIALAGWMGPEFQQYMVANSKCRKLIAMVPPSRRRWFPIGPRLPFRRGS